MSKRMTVVFDDEALYTAVKVEAARSGRHAKDLVTLALRKWFDEQEDADLSAGLAEVRDELRHDGGREAGEFFRELKAGRKPRPKN